MKKLLKTTSIVAAGFVVMSVTGYAEEAAGIPADPSESVMEVQEGVEVEPTAEMLEREEAIKAYHKARLEAKKEKLHARMEARGIDPDTMKDPNAQ